MRSQNYSDDQLPTMISHKTRRSHTRMPCILIGAALGLCILITLGGATAYYFLYLPSETSPLVLIHAPQNGDILDVGQTITIHAAASDPRKIVRIELWVDGQLVKAETSNVSGGISSFPLLAGWEPESTGAHTITVRAFNPHGRRGNSTVSVSVAALIDADNDKVPDGIDRCPDVPGSSLSTGCPDRDLDGVADAADACPDAAGVPASGGCPEVSEGDHDGDGTPDTADTCPDIPGTTLTGGCPDSDGDLVADAIDLCGGEPGSAAGGGCAIPDEPGDDTVPAPTGEIAPGSSTNDHDNDGAFDDVDPCPSEAGLAENDYCPPPTEDPPPSDGGLMFEVPWLFLREVIIPDFVEFEALHFEVSKEYRRVWCYAQLAGGEVQRYEFEPGEELAWNIEEALGGANSAHLAVPQDIPVNVFTECYGVQSIFGPRVFFLGSITRQHTPEEWDGHVIQADSTGGEPGGHAFSVRYHLCSPTCNATALQPPVITRFTTDGDRIHLYWEWNGDPRSIEGFKLYLNGNFIEMFPRGNSGDTIWHQRGTYCVDRWNFQMTTFDGPSPHTPDLESTQSNTVTWDSVPCLKLIRVTFETIDLHDPPADEGSEHNPGPLSGTFTTTAGVNMEALNFDAVHCPRFPVPPFEKCFGFKLDTGEYSIQHIFDRIHEVHEACVTGLPCHARYFHASTTDTVTIGVNPGDDLTIRARIIDSDERDEDDVLYDEQATLHTHDLSAETSLTLPIPGEYLDLIVKVDLFPFDH